MERTIRIPLLFRPFAAVACLVAFIGIAIVMSIGVLIAGKIKVKGL